VGNPFKYEYKGEFLDPACETEFKSNGYLDRQVATMLNGEGQKVLRKSEKFKIHFTDIYVFDPGKEGQGKDCDGSEVTFPTVVLKKHVQKLFWFTKDLPFTDADVVTIDTTDGGCVIELIPGAEVSK